jgi:hypothetical protein
MLQLDIEPFSDPGCAATGPVARDTNTGRVLDHAAGVDLGEFDGHSASEVPSPSRAGEDVGHPVCWTKCWTRALEARSTITVEHPFRAEIPLKTVKKLSPITAATVANDSSKCLI